VVALLTSATWFSPRRSKFSDKGDLITKDGLISNCHPAALGCEQLLADCLVRRLRRSGPGGQHRNKVETAVVLRHQPSGTMAEANERRSQAENRAVALFRLRVNLALEVRHPQLQAPSPLWLSRFSGGPIAINASHADFPAILAEALDVVAACEADVKRAAASLGCTPSQLVKLLRKEPRALALVNDWRRQRGLHSLKGRD
jgi:hypothetical protein